jgi:uncharacterized membrane protein HdeD (DUF308 family)
MIDHGPFPLKPLSLRFLLIFCGLITAYIIFMGATSVWVGLNHLEKDGFWMPILIGIIFPMAILWSFLRFTKFVLYRSKEKDIIYI